MARILREAARVDGRRLAEVVRAADLRAREIVSAAEERAAVMVAAAEADRDRVRAEAARAGREDGLALAAAMLAAAEGERRRRLEGIEPVVARLALDVAGRVLGRALEAEPSLVVELAARAVAEVRDRREVSLRVNPGDRPRLEAGRERLQALLGRGSGVGVVVDEAVPPGGVVVETEAGRVDGGVRAQLDALERALGEVLR